MSPELIKLKKIIRVPEPEAITFGHSYAKIKPTQVSVFIPRTPIKKLNMGVEKATMFGRKPKATPKRNTLNQKDFLRSTSRAVQTLYEYVELNPFDGFGSLTFNPAVVDRYNRLDCDKRVKNFLDYQRKLGNLSEYIVVHELHGDGAHHYHFMSIGLKTPTRPAIYPDGNKKLTKKGTQIHELVSWDKSGFSNYFEFPATDRMKVAGYTSKYIKKQMFDKATHVAGKKRLWASRGLVKPPRVTNPAFITDSELKRAYKTFDITQGELFIGTKHLLKPGVIPLLKQHYPDIQFATS